MRWLSLIAWITLCLIAGFIGSIFSPEFNAGGWYQTLEKSSLTPPNIVFPIVWNILFVLMGFAAWRIWVKHIEGKNFALLLFFTQLGLNILWSYLFFGLQRPDLSLIEIIVLWFAIIVTVIIFIKKDKTAGILLLPYLCWVSFAIYLNYSIYHLNNY